MNCFRVSEAQALGFKARIRASPSNVPAPHERTSADPPARSEQQNGSGGKASSIPVATVTGKASNLVLSLAPHSLNKPSQIPRYCVNYSSVMSFTSRFGTFL